MRFFIHLLCFALLAVLPLGCGGGQPSATPPPKDFKPEVKVEGKDKDANISVAPKPLALPKTDKTP